MTKDEWIIETAKVLKSVIASSDNDPAYREHGIRVLTADQRRDLGEPLDWLVQLDSELR